ncbi:hypothetical protein VTO42DRAFT_4515 [Malbranchea cinnamomea]
MTFVGCLMVMLVDTLCVITSNAEWRYQADREEHILASPQCSDDISSPPIPRIPSGTALDSEKISKQNGPDSAVRMKRLE